VYLRAPLYVAINVTLLLAVFEHPAVHPLSAPYEVSQLWPSILALQFVFIMYTCLLFIIDYDINNLKTLIMKSSYRRNKFQIQLNNENDQIRHVVYLHYINSTWLINCDWIKDHSQ